MKILDALMFAYNFSLQTNSKKNIFQMDDPHQCQCPKNWFNLFLWFGTSWNLFVFQDIHEKTIYIILEIGWNCMTLGITWKDNWVIVKNILFCDKRIHNTWKTLIRESTNWSVWQKGIRGNPSVSTNKPNLHSSKCFHHFAT